MSRLLVQALLALQRPISSSRQVKPLPSFKAEVEAAVKLGLLAAFVQETSLPFPIEGAVAFDQQAQFHPRKYLLHLARAIADESNYVFEKTRVTEVNEGDPCQGITSQGVVHATEERFQRLEDYARSRFGVTEIAYCWSSQDFVSFD